MAGTKRSGAKRVTAKRSGAKRAAKPRSTRRAASSIMATNGRSGISKRRGAKPPAKWILSASSAFRRRTGRLSGPTIRPPTVPLRSAAAGPSDKPTIGM
jgi:hypothetical protein